MLLVLQFLLGIFCLVVLLSAFEVIDIFKYNTKKVRRNKK
jgi:hypothetical protein